MKKFLNIFFVLIITMIVLIFVNLNSLKKEIIKNYPNLRFTKYLFKKESLLNKINNDYNVNFLPNTQFVKLNFLKKKLNFNKEYYNPNLNDKSINYSQWGTFFLEPFNDKILISDYLGNFYFLKHEEIFNMDNKVLNLNKIETNININRLYDILIVDSKIFVSFSEVLNNCKKSYVSEAIINLEFLEFEKIFETPDCNDSAATGKLEFYKHNNKKGILVSTSSGEYNNPDYNSQSEKSVYGKIIFIDTKNYHNYIFSSGHRAIQGLYAENNLIISTEHGPKGGDEINKIIYAKNYGWPIASYGEKYDFDYEKEPYYKKIHSSNNFEEPIFYFTESIGINEIKKLDNNFSDFFKNKYILASLNGRSIYFISFDEEFKRLMTYEKVFLNERVRDIVYDKKLKTIFLALEENGELGIITAQ